MRKTRVVVGAFAMALFGWLVVIPVAAQPLDKRTYFTFSGPVAVPGVTLPAGKYLFRFVDPNSRSVVQVLSEDGTTAHALFLTRVAQRAEPSAEPELRFMETAAGTPRAVQTWWYPGERIGYEFVYPKRQARVLAKGTGQPVLTTVGESPEPPTPEMELALISPAGEESKVVATAPSAVVPAGPMQIGELAPPTLEIQAQARMRLPKTATLVPLIGLAGLAFLLAAALISGIGIAQRK